MAGNSSAISLFDQPQEALESILSQVERTIVGKRAVVETLLAALLAGGHVLLEDVPGVGKTMLAQSLAGALDLSFKRIQFTPDLLPSDVTGVSVFNQKYGEFEFRHGPVFAQLVLADELNRTSSKTQAALLEAMEERQVTADGRTYALPEPFAVIATQNPIDYEGTSGLPEAQLDRFMLRLSLGYPGIREEADMLGRWKARDDADRQRKPVVLKEEFVRLQRQVRNVHVEEELRHYIVRLAAATRSHPELSLGASPRASISLMLLSQAKAFMAGRGYVVPDDVKPLVQAVFGHRLLLTQEALIRGKRVDVIIGELLQQVPVPNQQRRASGA